MINLALEAGALAAVTAKHWAEGGAGAVELANAVVEACNRPPSFQFLYPLDMPIKEKLITVARQIYGADEIEFSEVAEKKIEWYNSIGFDNLPICNAKTHLSLSSDPALKGVPTGFKIHVRDIRASVGAGFLYAMLGNIMTVPGLATRPGFYDVDIDIETGRVIGLF